MDTAAIQGLHGAFGGTGVVVLNETVVVTLGLQKPVSIQIKKKKNEAKNSNGKEKRWKGSNRAGQFRMTGSERLR